VIALFGVLSATIYSVPPFRVKTRGILSPIPVIVGLYSLPILGGWFLVTTTFPFYTIMFLFGYAFMNEGFTLVNTCEDYQEDKEAGIKTWAHVLGLQHTLNLSFLFSILGYLCILALIIKTFLLSLTSNIKIIFIILLIILCFSTISISAHDIWKIMREDDKEVASKIYAKKMLQWFLITRYPLLLFALILIV
jgi:4-hydroxybenzoate polyprenyltransferase